MLDGAARGVLLGSFLPKSNERELESELEVDSKPDAVWSSGFLSGACETELVWFEIEIPMVKLLRAHGGCLGY